MRSERKIFITRFITLLLFFLMSVNLTAQEGNLADRVRDRIANYYDQIFEISSPEPGHVIIEGQVKTLYDKYRIFEIASFVKGVNKITNNIVVDTKILPDKIIADNVREELQYVNSILEPDAIKVRADNGIVFLEGTVSYFREKIMAETVASWQEGVRGIVNNLKVLPLEKAKSDENLRNIFNSILNERFGTEDNISFTVKDGIVTLEGKTSDLWAKNQIEKVFSGIKGVKEVKNNIKLVQ